MPGVLSTFREKIRTELETNTGGTFVPGIVEGPQGDRAIGCVWVASVHEVGDNVAVEVVDLRVRYFPQWQGNEQSFGQDTTELEDAAEAIQAALKDIQADQSQIAPMWYFRVVSVELDIEMWGVEAAVVAQQANPFDQFA